MLQKIGFGGSCHWCTEAIFQSLKGVTLVEQGWISSENKNETFSEAVIVNFDPSIVGLTTLISVHLYTHSCTSKHNMRAKYRSAIYYFDKSSKEKAVESLQILQSEFLQPIITEVIPYKSFRLNKSDYLNYHYSNPRKPFCHNVINPKLKVLLNRFGEYVEDDKPERLMRSPMALRAETMDNWQQ